MNPLYIHWNPDPVLFHIGNFGLRWYSIFWMIAILAASYFLAHPLEIVLPVRFLPNGDWIFTGYAGLASHGGTLGLIIALYFFYISFVGKPRCTTWTYSICWALPHR